MPYQLVPNIYIYQSSMWQTNSVVIVNEAANIVIDPCYFPVEIQVIADFVNRHRSFNKYIIFTHSDFDHIVGYQHFKGARLIAQEELCFCDKEAQFIQLTEIDQTYYVNRKRPFEFPQPDVTFNYDYRIPLKEDELILVHAPGHTGDSCFIISRANRVMFAGDYLSDLEFPFVYFNTGAYMKTLDLAAKLVKEYDVEYLVPGHGDIAKGSREINDRIIGDKDYLQNLTETAQEMFVNGVPEREITEVLKSLKYRSEPIENAMAKMHLENIRLVIKELHKF